MSRRSSLALLVATRKGAFIFKSDSGRRSWKTSAPIKLGQIAHHMVQDPRNPRVLMLSMRTGHLGPTMYRSTDRGKTWTEAATPPAFPKAAEGKKAEVVDHSFWLTPGHASEPKVWYAGVSPQGLFRSEDGGDTWQSLTGLNEHPEYSQWMGAQENGRQFPGLRFRMVDEQDRIRQHMRVFIDSGEIRDLGSTVPTGATLHIVQALSGG